jgi:hypothetical protein
VDAIFGDPVTIRFAVELHISHTRKSLVLPERNEILNLHDY